MALLPCLQNDLRVEIYPSQEGAAQGSLYLDDGASFEYAENPDTKSASLSLAYKGNAFSSSFTSGSGYQNIPNVASVVVFEV